MKLKSTSRRKSNASSRRKQSSRGYKVSSAREMQEAHVSRFKRADK